MLRFTHNKLVAVSSALESLPREMYKTDECLRDLESLKALVGSIRFVRVQPRPNKRKAAAFGKNLKRARDAYEHTQQQAADKIGVGQPEYNRYEKGKRMPQRANRKKCDRYVAQAPRSASAS
jgi:DNA-binding XRE family transcriptional regulator